MTKRWIAALLALCMACSLGAFAPAAQAEDDGIVLLETDEGEGEESALIPIIGLDGEEPEGRIPADPEKSGACGPNAVWSFENETLTISGSGPMDNWSTPWGALFFVDPYGVGGLEVYHLKKLVIEEGITSIGSGNFIGNEELEQATLPSTLESIGFAAFANCKSLTNINFPEGLLTIGDEAFHECGLISVSLPASLTEIGLSAFGYCRDVTSYSVAAGSTAFSSENGILYNKDRTTLRYYPAARTDKRFVLPSSVTKIGDYAFCYAKLENAVLPSGLTSIERGAFAWSSLKQLSLPSGLTDLGERAFNGCKSLKEMTLPAGLRSVSGGLFMDSGVEKVVVGDGATSMGWGAFGGCQSLKELVLPDSITNIAYEAFMGCSALPEIDLPDQLQRIDPMALSGCSSLSSIVIPDSVVSIDEMAMINCSSLRTVIIGSGVQEIGAAIFGDSTALSSVVFRGHAPTFDDYAFFSQSPISFVAYVPEGDETWTPNNMLDYGADKVTWVRSDGQLTAPELTEAFNSATGVRVSWKTVPGAVKYRLLRKNLTLNETQWRLVGETAECTLIDITAKSSNRYCYTAEAVGADGTVGPHDETGRTCTYIAMPRITNIRGVEGGMEITWDAPAGAKNFRVFRRDPAYGWVPFMDVRGTQCIDTEAPVGARCWYTVRAVSLNGMMNISSYNATGWSGFRMAAPELTEAFNSATGVRVSWQQTTGAVKYRLLRKNLTLGETQWKTVGETAECTLIDTTAKSSNRYTYTVQPVDARGNAGPVNETGRTCTYIAVARITKIGSVPAGIKLVWNKPAGAKNFRVFRKTPNGKWMAIADVLGDSYLDTKAVKGTTYYYTVRAITLDGKMYINSYNATGWKVTRS
ncbi:MAG: leucine-rich repeat protein [Oscillospiraceae bacterium]|nr:leucine-rich repeat protein [Oscillospiraceae bacterium]